MPHQGRAGRLFHETEMVDKLGNLATALRVPISELFDFPEDQPKIRTTQKSN